MKPTVVVNRVAFEFPNGRQIFQDLSFSLDSRITALVGPNGAGKTSLAKLLSGELEPSAGAIQRHCEFIYFSQREVPGPVSVEHHLHASGYAASALGEELLVKIGRDQLCTHLSGGQWMRVRLACALGRGFLILDEPTNDLDREGRQAVLRFLRQQSKGVLLISHDRECLGLCDSVLELSNRGLAKFGGAWDAYQEAKQRERQSLNRNLEVAKRSRDAASAARAEQKDRQEKRNRHGAEAAARGGLPKILVGGRKRRAQVTTGKVDAQTLERAEEAVNQAFQAYEELKIDPVMYAGLMGRPIPAGKMVAEAKAFNVRFKDWVFAEDLNFSWRGNLRLALKGGNGSGKSTLLRAVLGEDLQTRGQLRRGGLNTLYIDQRCAQLDDSKSIFENVREVCSGDESEIRNGLAKFLFVRDMVFQSVASLSGGERLRAALARGLLATERPELLVLDEPTNNLDLGNIEFLENLVRAFPAALIVISHDEIFLKSCGVDEEFELKTRT